MIQHAREQRNAADFAKRDFANLFPGWIKVMEKKDTTQQRGCWDAETCGFGGFHGGTLR